MVRLVEVNSKSIGWTDNNGINNPPSLLSKVRKLWRAVFDRNYDCNYVRNYDRSGEYINLYIYDAFRYLRNYDRNFMRYYGRNYVRKRPSRAFVARWEPIYKILSQWKLKRISQYMNFAYTKLKPKLTRCGYEKKLIKSGQISGWKKVSTKRMKRKRNSWKKDS